MKNLILGTGFVLLLAGTTSCATLNAKETTIKSGAHQAKTNQSGLSQSELNQAQLAQMLAPIALYPDSLLTHILIASTYPIEVVEAERWISKNDDLSAAQLSKKLDNKDWEPSIKALAMFPNVLARLSNDLGWTQQLGDAFLQSEEDVLQTIQDLRYQAEQAGNLDKMDNVKITREDKNIIIQPVQKEVIYVPYYDTRHVYGHWHWSLYPPIYWDWGHRVNYSHHRPFAWHSGVHISWNFFFSNFHWHNRHVVVVNHRNTHRYTPRKHIIRSGYAKRWAHKPYHRRGVTYRTKYVNQRYGSHRPVVHKTVSKYHKGTKQYLSKHLPRHNHSTVKGHQRKIAKHEVLQKKFKAHKPSKQRAVFEKRINKDNYHKAVANKSFNKNKAYSKNREVVRKNTAIKRQVTQPTIKKTTVVKRQTTVQTRSTPQRVKHKQMRRSQEGVNRSGHRRIGRKERR